MTRKSPFILWLNGASGVGKTTTLWAMEARVAQPSWVFMHNDGLKVPFSEEMVAEAGPLSKFAHMSTHWWIEKAIQKYPDPEVVVVDGQTNFDFFEDACQQLGVNRFAAVLLDCDWDTISDRLANQRKQPELINPDMENWVRFLRNQAQSRDALIINTSRHTTDEIVDMILETIQPV